MRHFTCDLDATNAKRRCRGREPVRGYFVKSNSGNALPVSRNVFRPLRIIGPPRRPPSKSFSSTGFGCDSVIVSRTTFAKRIELVGNNRFRQMPQFFDPFDAPRDRKFFRPIRLDHFPVNIERAVRLPHLEGRAHFPVALHAAPEEIFFRKFALG